MNDSIFDIPADLDTPVSAYMKLGPLSPKFLLESVEVRDPKARSPLQQIGRYSMIGLGTAFHLRISGDRATYLDQEILLKPGKEGICEVLREALARSPLLTDDSANVPFGGGLVGFTSYDLARKLETVRTHAPQCSDTPDALYVAPNSLVIFDHVTRMAALLHHGRQDERDAMRREVARCLAGQLPPFKSGGAYSREAPSVAQKAFMTKVEQAKDYIRAGDVFQLVLSICQQGETDICPFQVYRALRRTNPSPYMYFFDVQGRQIVGSSPEALVKMQQGNASLRPIAGTRPRGEDASADKRLECELLKDEKEAAEHVMLVDLARNDLGRVAVPGTIRVHPYRSVERYSHVMHLVSGVEGQVAPEKDQFDVFAAAFPAGTVVGAPKVRALELIDSLEPTLRGLYAGTVGYFGHGDRMDQAIAIRTLTFENGRYAYQAGAGIVADSVPRLEFEEILAKGNAMRRALEIAAGGAL